MITPRLEMILRYATGKICADIGTDHAYIPIELSKRKIRAIATDIMPGPLKIAEENVKKNEAPVELRLGAGLEPINKGEADCIIIAGMGGEMIEKILSDSPEKATGVTLILQPMNRQYELRTYLLEKGFQIINEDLAVEGFKVYNLLVAKKAEDGTKMPDSLKYNSDIDKHLPPALYGNPCFSVLLEKKKREFTRILSGLRESQSRDEKEIRRLEGLLFELEKIERKLNL